MYSIIVPVLNEAALIQDALQALQSFRRNGHEVIVVDGGSTDNSIHLAEPWADKVIHSEKGRARQMNAGAFHARHPMLCFLHIDTRLPAVNDTLLPEQGWGFFRVRLSGGAWVFRVIETLMNQRSRLTAIATGDQCLFVDTGLFQRAGHFPDIPLMEDITLCKTLRRLQKPVVMEQPVVTSSRRWEKHGVLKTVFEMWSLRLLYFFGVSPQHLVAWYHHDA